MLSIKCTQSVCYITVASIIKELIKNGYQQKVIITSDAIFKDLATLIINYPEPMFLMVSHFGHSYILEVSTVEDYVRLYQSYGNRFSLEEWINPDLELISCDKRSDKRSGKRSGKRSDERSDEPDYSYNLDIAQDAKEKYGSGNQIPISDFLNIIDQIGSASKKEFPKIYQKLFGVPSKYFQKGKITVFIK